MISVDDNGRLLQDDHIINILSAKAVGPLGTPGQVLAVNADATALEWVTGGGGSVTGSGAAGQVALWASASVLEGDDLYYDKANDVLIIGGTAIVPTFAGRVQTIKTNGASGNTNFTYSSTATDVPFFAGVHARGTLGSETATQSGDGLVRLNGNGYGATTYGTVNSRIEALAAENYSDTAKGSYWAVSVTQPTTTTLLEVARFTYNNLLVAHAIAGGTTSVRVNQTDNTNAASHALLTLSVGGSSGGNPYIDFNITGSGDSSFGIDNADSDKLKFSATVGFGSSVVFSETRTGGWVWSPSAVAAGETAVTLTAAAHTAVVAELPDVKYNLGRTVTFTHASVPATQRAFQILKPTYATSSSTDTITTAATLYIDAAPAAGTGITITNGYALWVDAGLSQFDGGIQDATLTSSRVVYVSTNGRLADNSVLTFNGTTLTVSGTTVDGNVIVAPGSYVGSGTSSGPSFRYQTTDIDAKGAGINVPTAYYIGIGSAAGRFVFTDAATDTIAVTSANFLVGSLTSGRVVYAGASGLLQDDADMTFDGTTLTLGVANTSDGTLIINRFDAATNTIMTGLILARYSSNTPAAALGVRFSMQLESTVQLRDAFINETTWVVATDASRTARALFLVYDTGAREAFRVEASGSAPLIGFLGATAVARQSVAAAAAAGGTGATAGAYDTAAHRDALITLVNNMRTAGINLGLWA